MNTRWQHSPNNIMLGIQSAPSLYGKPHLLSIFCRESVIENLKVQQRYPISSNRPRLMGCPRPGSHVGEKKQHSQFTMSAAWRPEKAEESGISMHALL